MRYHVVAPDLRGHGRGAIMFLQTGNEVIPGTQFQLYPRSSGTWDGCRIPGCLHPRNLQFIPGDQAFQKEAGFWVEGIMGES